MFFQQWQTGSVGRCSVSLLSALSPPRSLRRSPPSPVKALPCVQLHLRCACHQVPPHLQYAALLFVHFQSLYSSLFICDSRLAQLLGHDFILKPQYDFVASDTADVWLSCTHLTAALTDPVLIEASCPLTMSGMSFLIVADLFCRACI